MSVAVDLVATTHDAVRARRRTTSCPTSAATARPGRTSSTRIGGARRATLRGWSTRSPARPAATLPPVRTDATVPGTVLAVYAHPDDPEVACGGSLARWVDEGAVAHLVVVNRGEKGSSSADVDPDALAADRAAEVAEAAAVLGLASFELLGYPDGESENDLELRGRLVEVVRRLRPTPWSAPTRPRCTSVPATSTTATTGSAGTPVLDAVAPAAASPLYFPDARPGPPGRAGVPLRARCSRTPPSTSAPCWSASRRPWPATAARSARGGSG